MKDTGTSLKLQTFKKWINSCKNYEQLANTELFIMKQGYYFVMGETIKSKRASL